MRQGRIARPAYIIFTLVIAGNVQKSYAESVCGPLFGMGYSLLTARHSDGQWHPESVVSLELGQCISARVHVVEQFNSTFALQEEESEQPGADHSSLSVNIQIRAFSRRYAPVGGKLFMPSKYFDSHAFRVRAGLGVELAESRASRTVGPLVQAGLSWLPSQGEDYEMGIELRAQTTLFREGLDHSISLLLTAKLL